MLRDMRVLARNYLKQELDPYQDAADLEAWYRDLRDTNKSRLFPFLVEPGERVRLVYIVSQMAPGLITLEVQEVAQSPGGGGCPTSALPFVKPSGAQSPAIGPIIKRTSSGPSAKVSATTMQSFETLAESSGPWGSYFAEIVELLNNPRLRLLDGREIAWSDEYRCALEAIMAAIETKNTVFVALKGAGGLLPGEDPRYRQYLFDVVLAGDRYTTHGTPGVDRRTCALCGATGVTVYSNGVKGAGINVLNADREGSFASLALANAWKRYSVCAPCADLLFVFKAHVLKKQQDIVPFTARIAGSNALVLPSMGPNLPQEVRSNLWQTIRTYINDLSSEVEDKEEDLLELLKDVPGILSFTVLWASLGQNLEQIVGSLTHVLPSRLRHLSAFNRKFSKRTHPLFPGRLPKGHELVPSLNLDILHPLLYRPGPHGSALNRSANLRKLKLMVVESVYYGKPMPEARWHEEWLATARAYWDSALVTKGGHWGLIVAHDGRDRHQMSAARWMHRIAQFAWYLQQPEVGVFNVSESYFEPTVPALRPYFGPESGINSAEKAFAFVLGILYGKVLEVQGARGVNVSANALTWLKRLTLKGADLPELYVKTREKLISYEAESSPEIRAVVAELGRIATRLGNDITLDGVLTSYYLLLGQSMTAKVLPSKNQRQKEGTNNE